MDMPRQCFFACLCESDQDFIDRTGWVYHQGCLSTCPVTTFWCFRHQTHERDGFLQ